MYLRASGARRTAFALKGEWLGNGSKAAQLSGEWLGELNRLKQNS